MLDEPVKYEVFGEASLEGGRLIFSGDSDVVLRASAGGACCQSIFHLAGDDELEALHMKQNRERMPIEKRKKFLMKKERNYYRIEAVRKRLKENGIFGIIKHAALKVLGKLTGGKK